MAGNANQYNLLPLCTEVTGLVLKQDDWPWWFSAILTWLSMVSRLFASQDTDFINRTEYYIKHMPPGDIYTLYEEYDKHMRSKLAEANREKETAKRQRGKRR